MNVLKGYKPYSAVASVNLSGYTLKRKADGINIRDMFVFWPLDIPYRSGAIWGYTTSKNSICVIDIIDDTQVRTSFPLHWFV